VKFQPLGAAQTTLKRDLVPLFNLIRLITAGGLRIRSGTGLPMKARHSIAMKTHHRWSAPGWLFSQQRRTQA
jgi:hypothetical protein